MEELKNTLHELKNEYQSLKKELDEVAVNSFGMDEHGCFPSVSKFDSYVQKHKSDLENLKSLREQIRQQEYQQMSPEEQAREDEVIRLMKLKREGKL